MRGVKKMARFDVAIEFGRRCGLGGLPITDCPYKDKRKPDGRLTFSRAWRNAWVDGWHTGNAERLANVKK
jgi:ribosome modulation factor